MLLFYQCLDFSLDWLIDVISGLWGMKREGQYEGEKCPKEAVRTSLMAPGVGSLDLNFRTLGLGSSSCIAMGQGRQIP